MLTGCFSYGGCVRASVSVKGSRHLGCQEVTDREGAGITLLEVSVM